MRLIRTIAVALALASLLPSQVVEAALNACATPSRDGDLTVSGTSIVNTYYPASGSPGIGATAITIGALDGRGGTTPISAGDLLLIIQVQGASLRTSNSNAYGSGGTTGRGYANVVNAGNYEYVRAGNSVGTGGGTLALATPLQNAYSTATASTTLNASVAGRARYQVIRVPQYRNLVVNGTISAPGWNGATGGVTAFDVAATLSLNGSVNVTGAGFRGGGGFASSTGTAYAVAGTPDYATNGVNNAAHGSKGESISGTPYRVFNGTSVVTGAVTDMPGGLTEARGAPANAGGGGTDGNPTSNDQNTGGGGGANGGQGGQGGYAWCGNFNATNGCPQSGGLGGVALPNAGKADMFMGGGGGAGSTNDATGSLGGGVSSSGAPGGGVIMIRAGTLTGSGSLIANGGSFTSGVNNDGSGGGGGGGSIQIFATTNSGSITSSANGGNGMSNAGGGASHGPGGGGGGGVVISNFTMLTSVGGGAAGTTFASAAYGANYGATAGSTGVTDTAWTSTSLPGAVYSGAECSPNVSKAFTPATIATGGNGRLTVTVANPNPTLTLSSLAVTDNFPSGLQVFSTPSATTTCTSGTVTATGGGTSANLSGASLTAGASCAYSADVTSSVAGSYVNTIANGGVTGTMGGASVTNASPATATLTVTAGLTIQKTVKTVYDPINILTNPKAIPGAYVQYSLTVTNPSNLPITADSVVLGDVIPSNVQVITDSLYTQQNYPGARGPFQYLDGTRADGSTGTASGLTFTFVGLSSTTDSPSYSSDGTSFSYTPTTNANLVDPSIRAIRLQMFGTMAPSSVFTVNFLVRVN